MTPTTLHVAGASPYDVVIGDGVLDALMPMVGEAARRVAVIYDGDLTGTSALVRLRLDDGFREVIGIPLVPPGEQSKSFRSAESCWEMLGQAGFTRSDVVVTMGGGATTDLGGFVAATWLRGVKVVHVPTTLLGMVDAAIGGKTGMNTSAGKNLVGAFHQPAGVICELGLLRTLPRAELVSGLGEVIKCGFVADPEILRLVEAAPSDALDPASPVLRELVERAVQVKIDVVTRDPGETGGVAGHPGREVLNYGHTMAHAIEKATDYEVRHGEAVALGMVFVAELARLAGRLDDETAARHTSTLRLVGLPTSWSGAPFEDLLATMRVDKKTRGDLLRFVVLDGLAKPAVLEGPAEALLRSCYDVMGSR